MFRIELPEQTLIGSTFNYRGAQQGSGIIRSSATPEVLSLTSGESSPLTTNEIPSVLLVNGEQYFRVNTVNDLGDRNFIYNPSTNTVNTLEPITSNEVTVYTQNQYLRAIQSTLLLITTLQDYHTTALSISRNWGEQPSVSFTFRIPYTLRDEVLEHLRPGVETQILDIGLQVSGVQTKEIPASMSDVREVEVSVNLDGRWSGERLRAQSFLDPNDAQLQPTNYLTGDNIDQVILNGVDTDATTTLQAIASRSGTPLLFPETQVNVPRNGYVEVFDWAAEIEGLAEKAESFVYWSNPDGIQLIPWEAVTPHTVVEDDIRSEITTNLTRAARDYPGPTTVDFTWQQIGAGPALTVLPPLTPTGYTNEGLYRKTFEWEGAEVEVPTGALTLSETDGSLWILGNEVDDSNPDTRNRWRRRNRTQTKTKSGSSSVPLWAIGLRETTVNFDVTGYTQSVVETWTLDGVPTREVVDVYGFAFTAKDLEEGGGIRSASDFWTKIEHKDTTYYRDSGTGYALGYDTKGWRKVRYAQEDRFDPETLSAEGIELDLYNFITLPYIETQSLVLAQFADYYRTDSFANYSFAVDSQGNQVLQTDPNYVEPMFVIYEETESFATELIDNPEDPDLPPLVAGKENLVTRSIQPKTSYGFASTNIDLSTLTGQDVDDLSQNEFYIEIINNYSSEGAGFDGVAQDDSTNFNTGRPGEADRLPSIYTQRAENSSDEALAPTSYHLFSEGYDEAPRGTANFGSRLSLDTLKKAARSQLYKNNLDGGLSESFTIHFRPEIKEGDKVQAFINGTLRERRVQGVTHDIVLDGSINLRASSTQLDLVRDPGYLDPVFDINLIADVKPAVNFRIFKPHYVGRTLRKPTTSNGSIIKNRANLG